MISAPRSSRSRCVTALTAPRVPTGMNTGVCTTPCGVRSSPRRARPSRWVTVKSKGTQRLWLDSNRPLHSSASCILWYVKRLRVGVLYGGRSGEHEVSLASAAAVFAHLDKKRYEAVPIRIEKDGRWCLADRAPTAMSASDVIEQARLDAARPLRSGREVHMIARPSEETVLSIDRSASRIDELGRATVTGLNLDVIFPVLHGPYGEDGTVQGLLELANVPYV